MVTPRHAGRTSAGLFCLLMGVAIAFADETEPADAEHERPASVLRWISTYEPVYLLVDAEGASDAKFQLSFKYRLLNPDGPIARQVPVAGNVYFGYTQTALWDLEGDSRPFRDTSYRPRFFYLDEHIERWSRKHFRVGLETGAGHESNARENTQSRSLEMLYVKPILMFDTPHEWHWSVAPMFVTYRGTEENPNIARYRGHIDLHLSARKADGWMAAAHVRRGTNRSLGSVEINASYPLERIGVGAFLGFVHLQYFNGYGESLIDYNRKLESRVRLGVELVR